MYENIVNSLRHCAKNDCSPKCPRAGIGKGCIAGLKQEAAETIEELQGRVKTLTSELDEAKQDADYANEAATALHGALPCWVPVTERLPEHGWYLAYGPKIKMEVLHFHSAEEVWSSERYYNIEVTHWMPLPEPPKEEVHGTNQTAE